MPVGWFWETALSSKIGRSPTLILAPEAQLLHLCGHAAVRGLGECELLWFHDIAEVIRHYHVQLDWDLLSTQAQAFSLLRSTNQLIRPKIYCRKNRFKFPQLW